MDCFSHYGLWLPQKKRRSLPLHRNEGLEIVLITHGFVEWEVEGKVEVAHAGDLFYTLPWQRHGGVHGLEHNAGLCYAVIRTKLPYTRKPQLMEWHPDLNLSSEETLSLHGQLTSRRKHRLPATQSLKFITPELVRAIRQQKGYLYARGLALAALAELSKAIDEDTRPRRQSIEVRDRIRRFTRHLTERCAEDWTLEKMAEECGLRRSHFSSLIEELTGDSPITLLNRKRIELACRELTKGNTITEVAFASGFQSSQYFATVFKSFIGTTPTRWTAEQSGKG